MNRKERSMKMTQPKDVQPIRDQQQLEDMKWALKRHCSERDYILFVVGCETGLRVGDLLKLTTKQILDLKSKQHKILRVKEGKRGSAEIRVKMGHRLVFISML